MSLLAVDEEFFNYAGAVAYLHRKGITTATERTIKNAAYEGRRPLKRTFINNRIWFARSDIDNWLASSKRAD